MEDMVASKVLSAFYSNKADENVEMHEILPNGHKGVRQKHSKLDKLFQLETKLTYFCCSKIVTNVQERKNKDRRKMESTVLLYFDLTTSVVSMHFTIFWPIWKLEYEFLVLFRRGS